jgi:hypothetical protein
MYTKTLEDHRHFLLDLVRLKLWFLWGWLRDHPEEAFGHAFQHRIDIYRKTNIRYEVPVPRDGDEHPKWFALVAEAEALYKCCQDDPDASRFEQLGFELLRDTVSRRAENDCKEGFELVGFQCGSLRYDAPKPQFPKRVGFHIANAVAPVSIFKDPAYIPRCLMDLMAQTESKYGAKELCTGTWLNSHPKWLRNFPQEWMDNMEPRNGRVGSSNGHWGQFINARGTLNEPLAQQLRETGKLPYSSQGAWCTFEALRGHLLPLIP